MDNVFEKDKYSEIEYNLYTTNIHLSEIYNDTSLLTSVETLDRYKHLYYLSQGLIDKAKKIKEMISFLNVDDCEGTKDPRKELAYDKLENSSPKLAKAVRRLEQTIQKSEV